MTATVILIFAIAMILACGLGAASGYFFYRARHREALAEIESLDQDLTQREAELRRLKFQTTTTRVHAQPGDEAAYATLQERIDSLREELEQRELDLNILRQDYDLETRLLKQEIEQLRAGLDDEQHLSHQRLDAERAELGTLRARLDAQQRQLRDALDQLARDQQEHAHQAEQARAREAHLATREADLGGREARLEEREAGLAEHVLALGRQESQLAQRHAELARQEARLAEQEHHLAAQESQLADQAMLVTRREAQLAEREARPPAAEPPQESLLVTRLRQQIRLLEEEVARLRMPFPATAPLRPRPAVAPPEPAATTDALPAVGLRAAAGLPTFSPLSSFMNRGPAPRRPAHHDPLTRIPGITPAVQAELYQMGFTTFEQIARLSSADVRRIAERLGLDRHTIQDRWILEAQSRLFEQQAP